VTAGGVILGERNFMHSIAWWPTLFVVTVATVTDLRTRRVPNWLVLPFLVAGVVVSTVSRGWAGLESSVLGILCAASVLGLFYFLGGMGMGDVKLLASIGAWIGPQQVVFAFVFMGLAGGVMALGWALRGGFVQDALTGTADLVFGFRKRGLRQHTTLTLANRAAHKMPYAPAIAVGAILSFFAMS
jgi:prepilin peptidase CpaA